MKPLPLLVIVAITSAAALSSGCGPKEILGPVTGVVTCDGLPVPGALILFHNDAKGVHMLSVPADELGRFRVEMANGNGLPLGEYKVCVSPPIQDHPLGPIKAPPPDSKHDPYPNIPKRYRSIETSGLKLLVGEKTNVLTVEMKRE